MNIPQHSLAAVRLVTKIQARVRGPQLRNKQLLEAAKIGNIYRTKNLIKHGADVNAKGRYGWTALHWAADNGFAEIVKLLLDSGADIKATDNTGRTALHWAVTTEIVQLLLDSGADINAADNGGRTALHWAAYYGSADIVQALVIAGADLTDNDGLTALDFVFPRNYSNIENAIEAGKKELIAQLGALEKEHIEKSVELSDSLRKSLFKLSHTNNQDFLYIVLKSNAGKRTLGSFCLEPKVRLKKARQYSAEAATKI